MLPQTFDFVFVGNEHPIKGIDILDELLAKCQGKYSFALIGYLPKLKDKWEGAKEFKFFGVLKGQNKKDVLLQSRVFVLTSYHESFSMTLCEAVSLGIPSVCFNIPTLKSIYNHGVCFAKYKDVNSMWNYMKTLLCIGKIDVEYKFDWLEEARKVVA